MLFLDADVGVVNPTHLIEEWIDERVNVIFYDRIWNHEVMTGGYLIRNSEYSIEFLRNFAYFVNELPKDTYTGTDNGAIHVRFVYTNILTIAYIYISVLSCQTFDSSCCRKDEILLQSLSSFS
jgi:hypothetical protein